MLSTFELVGNDAFIQALSAMQSETQSIVEEAVKSAGNKLLEKIKSKLPPGKLRDSLYLKTTTTKEEISVVITWHDDVRDYAAPLELGHMLVAWGTKTDRYIQAYGKTGYLRGTFDEYVDEMENEIIDGINKALERFGE